MYPETQKKAEPVPAEILQSMSNQVRNVLNKLEWNRKEHIEEIRLRGGRPLMIQSSGTDYFVTPDGKVSIKPEGAYLVDIEEIWKTFSLLSDNSVYSYQEEIREGFITLKGGHRVGLTGKVVMDEKSIRNIKYISGLNFRIARQISGQCSRILPYIIKNKDEIYNTLIVSPPQCGKTTLLRELVRLVSNGVPGLLSGQKVGLVDERSEIAASYKGIPQMDVGMRTDVLDGCIKSMGMLMFLRSMSPKVIATDEIGSPEDMKAVLQVLHCGVRVLATIHAENMEDVKLRYQFKEIFQMRIFDRILILSGRHGPGTLESVIDGGTFQELYKADGRNEAYGMEAGR